MNQMSRAVTAASAGVGSPTGGHGDALAVSGRAAEAEEATRLVRVWLGSHIVVRYENNNADAAASFEHAMRRRYASCRVTNDPLLPECEAASR